ncbi:MAG: AAA family ATPase, partial [Caldilineaceae bacterium]|nr:AAA family ATPase [Caldilineaceae bacterium]
MQAPLRIVTLGPPHVTYLGAPFPVPRRQTRALLYRLAAAEEPLSRGHLLFLFWPDIDDGHARRRLTLLLSQLRRALPDPDLLRVTPTHVQLDPAHVWRDVAAFRRVGESRGPITSTELQNAVDLYQGPLLDGFNAADLPEYELWLETQRHRYARTYVAMLERLAAEHMAQQAWPVALDIARRHVAVDKLSETAHRNVIACYTALGNHRAARRQYDDCVAVLARELGVAPQAETVALMAHVAGDTVLLPLDEMPSRRGEDAPPATMPHLPDFPHDTPRPATYNLPYLVTPLIGRARELTLLETLLGDSAHRLITVTGLGGMGKTHLVVTAARRMVGSTRFADGICFVPLASVVNAADIPAAVLQAFEVGHAGDERDGRSTAQMLLDFLRTKRVLLILDNVEHLLAGAELLHDIVRQAPGVALLASSRLPLGLYGEHLFPLDELDFPPDDHSASLARYAAVQMFVECARRSDPTYALTAENAPSVARICRLVAG